jgi:benzoate membrane transport protein
MPRARVPASVVTAGFVTVLVGFTSSAAIVFQAARAGGASPAEVSSWIGALGIGMGVTCIGLSLRYRAPIVTAWSTPGAALLATSLVGVPMAAAIGAFMLSAVLIVVSGVSGLFERAIGRIPLPLAQALLAGVLVRFGLGVFTAMRAEFGLVCAMFVVYVVGRRWSPRYTMVAVLAVGVAVAGAAGLLRVGALRLAVTSPRFVDPVFSVRTMIGVGIPLFVVTMASQNLPGVAVLRGAGYRTPVSPLITTTGLTTLVLAPFGAFAINLAAITAAICAGPEAHEDPDRRYLASVTAGVFYLVIGVFGATVAGLFAAFPQALVAGVAGLALFPTIAGSLAGAMGAEPTREAALVTFLVTASGVAFAGVGSAFWGVVAGGAVLAVSRLGRGGRGGSAGRWPRHLRGRRVGGV